MDIDIKCRICHVSEQIDIPREDIKKWQDGALIQDAMPYLSPDQRELLISGICGPCFDKMFAE